MTLVSVDGEVLTPDVLGDEYLDELAAVVRAQHRRSKEALGEAIDAYFAIGEALLAARNALRSTSPGSASESSRAARAPTTGCCSGSLRPAGSRLRWPPGR